MQLKLVTWNMDHWKTNKAHRRDAWEYLSRDLMPDIALLQETVFPADLDASGYHGLWREVPGSRIGGTGILSRWPLAEIPAVDSYPGCLVAADVALPGGHALTLISLYGLLEKVGRVLFSITTLHRMLSDLTPLLVDRQRRVVLGGDFNASLQCDEEPGEGGRRLRGRRLCGASHRILFERIADFGLTDCLAQFHAFPVQTWRPKRGFTPWQLDYLFAGPRVSPHLRACDVLAASELQALSDHNPVVAEFDLP